MSVNIFVNSPGASLLPRDYFSQITHANKSWLLGSQSVAIKAFKVPSFSLLFLASLFLKQKLFKLLNFPL